MYGPQPDLEGKYRSSKDFKDMYRAYQWTQGFDAMVAMDTPQQCRLICNSGGGCPFNILAEYTTFTEPPLTGQSGFYISPVGFHPSHTHPAPYHPMDVTAENERRKTLMHDDPSLENPPLKRALGISGSVASSGGAPEAAVPGGFVDGASVASTPSVAHQQLPFQQPPQPQAQAPVPIPGAIFPPQRQPTQPGMGAGHMNGMHQGSPSNSVGQYSSPAPPYLQHWQQHIYGTSQTQYSPFSHPPSYSMQKPPPPLNPYPSASPAESSHVFATRAGGRKPLEAFLLTITPQFEPYLHLFEKNGIPLTEDPQNLLDLDSGRDDDRSLFDVFKDVKGMPLAYVALAADGVRKAKKKQLVSGSREIDPRIAVGLEKANAERWVRAKIAEGHARQQEQRQLAAPL
ncbi:hypothetical protein Rt10032_c13g5140 [Rhodotorula toruloides]|uniref:Uncharacterized protein n=1 Tax=Rhodotorula toruloides TaxID=5286 RepID=A0A511KL71_RHOTO|nr:hypothetical protein Rt10032_c13g5140 [Rhodotorula toruloides]